MNEQSFYPGGRGNIVRDPQDLPRWIAESNIRLENATESVYSSESDFWTQINRAGAWVDITAANIWTQIVNITGKGFLGNVIASHGNTGVEKTIGIRVEYDDMVWTWEETFVSGLNWSTLVLGALSPGEGIFPYGNRLEETADAFPGFLAAGVAGRVFPTTALMSSGAPVLEFKQSLVVSVKNSQISADNQGRKAGCTFVLR